MIWKSIKFHLFSEDSFPRDFYLRAYSMLCCANDLNHFLFLIKAPNIRLPSSLHSFPRLKDTEPSPARIALGKHVKTETHSATCIIQTANAGRKLKGREREEQGGKRPPPNIKGSPQKYRLESSAQCQIFIRRWCSSLMLFDLE